MEENAWYMTVTQGFQEHGVPQISFVFNFLQNTTLNMATPPSMMALFPAIAIKSVVDPNEKQYVFKLVLQDLLGHPSMGIRRIAADFAVVASLVNEALFEHPGVGMLQLKPFLTVEPIDLIHRQSTGHHWVRKGPATPSKITAMTDAWAKPHGLKQVPVLSALAESRNKTMEIITTDIIVCRSADLGKSIRARQT